MEALEVTVVEVLADVADEDMGPVVARLAEAVGH